MMQKTHPTARTCSALGENAKQKTCMSVENGWWNDKSLLNIFHITTWPLSSPLAINCCSPATDQCTVVNLCCKHTGKLATCIKHPISWQHDNTWCCSIIYSHDKNHHHTTTILRHFFRDYPGDLVLEENFWTSRCKGRLTEADTLTIQLGATPSRLTSAYLHLPPIFFTGQMLFLLPNQQYQKRLMYNNTYQ